MSVINKMLKDLEQRQEPEPNQSFTSPNAEYQATGNGKQIWVVAGLSSVIIVLIAAVVWLLMNNDTPVLTPAKSSQIQSNAELAQSPEKKLVASTQVDEDKEQQLALALAQKEKEDQVSSQVQSANSQPKQSINDKAPVKTQAPLKTQAAVTNNNNERSQQIETVTPQHNSKPREIAYEQIKSESKPSVSAPIVVAPEVTIAPKKALKTSEPGFSIQKTSKVLSKAERIEKLMAQAQKSFDQGYITESISQLKEVLAADDSHIDARNLLAVAWYGRGENQMAVTILNDGLSRYPSIEKWRLTAAKMFFKENNPAGAFSYLDADLTSASAEYHTMKGTLARQLQRYDKAEIAYLMLTQIQPDIGNWWLGYAIALDSQSKSELALQSYKMVLEKGGVSPASLNFAQQRIQELQG